MARYTLSKVRPTALAAARALATAEYCMKPDPQNPQAANEMHLLAWIVPVRLRFDPARQALFVESDDPEQWLRAQAAVEELGERIDAALA